MNYLLLIFLVNVISIHLNYMKGLKHWIIGFT